MQDINQLFSKII